MTTTDVFIGLPVREYASAVDWYERFLGATPSFLPDETEAVWELAEHRYLYIDVRPQDAGHSMVTLFVSDFDSHVSDLDDRGFAPTEIEQHPDGLRKAIFHDPDGNEIAFAGTSSVKL